MNIIKLDIETQCKHPRAGDILRDKVVTAFEPFLPVQTITHDARMEWNSLGQNLKALFSEASVLVTATKEGNRLFLIDSSQSRPSTQLTLEVLIISPNQDINIAVNSVLDYIENRVDSKDCSVTALTENAVYLYPFNPAINDIFDATYRIKTRFEKRQSIFNCCSSLEMTFIVLVLISTSTFFVLAFLSNFTNDAKMIFRQFTGAGLIYLVTRAAEKIIGIIRTSDYKIHLTDLSNMAEPLCLPDLAATISPSELTAPDTEGE